MQVKVIRRVDNKLTGREFGEVEALSVASQVHRLIEQARAEAEAAARRS